MKTDVHEWSLTVVNFARQEFKALIAALPPAQREAVGTLKDWSPKDEMAHLEFWIDTFVTNLTALRDGQPLMDISDYLRLNDDAWAVRKDWSWATVEEHLARALNGVETHLHSLNTADLTDAAHLTLEPDRTTPRPLIRSLLYDVIDHPLLHVVGLYGKCGANAAALAMLDRATTLVSQPGLSKWTSSTRSKLKTWQKRVK
jgi:hypothetical protein